MTSLVLATANSTTAAGSLMCPSACRPLGGIWTTSHQLSLVCSALGMSLQWTSHPVTHGDPAITDLAYSCRLRRPGTSSTLVLGLVSCTELTSPSVTSHSSKQTTKWTFLIVYTFVLKLQNNHTYKTVHEMCNLKNLKMNTNVSRALVKHYQVP